MSLGREAHEGFGRTTLLVLLLTSFLLSCFILSPKVGAQEQPWTLLDGFTPDAPAVTGYTPPSGPPYLILYLAARGMDNSIWYRTKVDTGDWSNWIRVPGFTDARVAICAFANKLCFVCKQAGSNHIWYGYYPCSSGLVSGSFSGWTLLDGFTPGAVSLAADITGAYMYMAMRGMDDSIWYRWMGTTSNVWSGWAKIPGHTDVSPAIAHHAITGSPYRRLYFVCKEKASSNIWFGYLTIYPDFPFVCVWNGLWTPLSGFTRDALTFATFSPAGSYKYLASLCSMDNRIQYRPLGLDGTWGDWHSPGIEFYASSPVGIFGVDSGIWFVARQDGTNDIWAKWHQLPM